MKRHPVFATFALAAGLALAGAFEAGGLHRGVAAQEATPAAMAAHPSVGTWFSVTPLGPAISVYGADGALTVVFAPTQAGQQGATYHSAALGSWEPTGERSVRFTMIQVTSDAAGTYLGTVTIDGYPTVADDGQTFVDESPDAKITVRDAANAEVMVIGGDGSTPPVTSVRVKPGAVVFPAGTPAAATPAA